MTTIKFRPTISAFYSEFKIMQHGVTSWNEAVTEIYKLLRLTFFLTKTHFAEIASFIYHYVVNSEKDGGIFLLQE